jgi:altronate hydrolase
MRSARSAILLDSSDNVATALVDLAAGQSVALEQATVAIATDIPRGHKFALRAIAEGEPVIKYGQPIGRATAAITPGEHVHTHNCASQRAQKGEGARR